MLICVEQKHFKRISTLLATSHVKEKGDKFGFLPINPASIIKCHKSKTIANLHQLLVTPKEGNVINSVYT